MDTFRPPIIKGRPIFRRHLYISATLFASILLLSTLTLVYLAQESSRERVNLELRTLSEEYAQQFRELKAFSPETSSLNAGINRLLAGQSEVIYLFVQDLNGNMLAQGFKEGREFEQVRFGELLVTPKNPRPPEVVIRSLQNPSEELADRIVPLPSPGQDQLLYIHIGISRTAVERQFLKWKGTILNRIFLTVGGIVVLLAGVLLYVLWLLKKAQEVEAEAHVADQMAYIGTLASGLAHEIRNPLSAMNLNLQMIEEDLPGLDCSPDLAPLLQSTRQEIRRLERLATHFLLYAKPLQLERRTIDLSLLLTEVRELVKNECRQENIELVLQLPGQPLPFQGDADLLKQAFLNLVVNALDAVKSSPRALRQIILELHKKDSHIKLSVLDSGTGISSEEAPQIFKVFFSGKRGGTGLGLPIAQRIIESHGGNIRWQNRPEGGTEFSITL
jgi:two-component system, NtrC family, sensor histidine kinase HydH